MGQARFEQLLGLMRTLRGPDGCPWDREQTHESLKSALLEETWEVIAEIDRNSPDGLMEELGDLLLHIVFHAQIASENKQFDIEDVINGVAEKLVRRHPHIFGNESALTADEVEKTWERVKQQERALKPNSQTPPALPALMAATKTHARLERNSKTLTSPLDAEQIRAHLDQDSSKEESIGALLYSVVGVARKVGVNPEMALSKWLAEHDNET